MSAPWKFFTSLLPNWKFFDDFDAVATLHYRIEVSQGVSEIPWIEALRPEPRTLLAIIYNPRANLRLAKLSLLGQYLQDAAESSDAADLESRASHALVLRLLREEIKMAHPKITTASFRFRVALRSGTEGSLQDAIRSGIQSL